MTAHRTTPNPLVLLLPHLLVLVTLYLPPKRTLRTAILPIVLGLHLVPVFHHSTGLSGVDQGIAFLAMGGFLQAIDLLWVTQPEGEERRVVDEDVPEWSWRKLRWAFALMTAVRGVGWRGSKVPVQEQ